MIKIEYLLSYRSDTVHYMSISRGITLVTKLSLDLIATNIFTEIGEY